MIAIATTVGATMAAVKPASTAIKLPSMGIYALRNAQSSLIRICNNRQVKTNYLQTGRIALHGKWRR
jgi:hypothetical protein